MVHLMNSGILFPFELEMLFRSQGLQHCSVLAYSGKMDMRLSLQVVPLRLMGNLTFFDYYVLTDVSTQPTTEWALSGRPLEPMGLKLQAEATVIAPSDVQSGNLPSVHDKQYFLHCQLAHIGDDMYDATVKCVW